MYKVLDEAVLFLWKEISQKKSSDNSVYISMIVIISSHYSRMQSCMFLFQVDGIGAPPAQAIMNVAESESSTHHHP